MRPFSHPLPFLLLYSSILLFLGTNEIYFLVSLSFLFHKVETKKKCQSSPDLWKKLIKRVTNNTKTRSTRCRKKNWLIEKRTVINHCEMLYNIECRYRCWTSLHIMNTKNKNENNFVIFFWLLQGWCKLKFGIIESGLKAFFNEVPF